MSDIDHISKILIFSHRDNVTLDYYITPRLSEQAIEKTQLIDPHHIPLDMPLPAEQKIAVIINRYLSIKLFRWILKFQSQIEKLIWVVDDDYFSMVIDRSIPLRVKRRPLVTSLLYPLLRHRFDLLIASTDQIAQRYPALTSTVRPPIFDLTTSVQKPLNCKKLYYFAKMHNAEHKFLYPIIKEALHRDPELSFTVIATGGLKDYWESLPRVNAIPELSYPDYCTYIESLVEGGLFLVPMMQSSLNHYRSYAKLIEVARTSSAPILAQHKEFETCLEDSGIKTLPNDPEQWLSAILKASKQGEDATMHAKKLRERLMEIYEEREMIL